MNINFEGLLKIILKHRFFILVNTVSITLLIIFVSFVIPARFKSKAILMPKRLEFFTPDSIKVERIKLPVPSEYYFLPSLMTPSHLYAEILKTPRVLMPVVKNYKLKEYFKKKSLEDAMEKLKDHVHIKITPAGLIVISVEMRDKNLARNINSAIIENLQEVLGGLDYGIWSKMGQFLLYKMKEIRDTINFLQNQLTLHRVKYKTIFPDSEYLIQLSNYSELFRTKLNLEFQRDYLSYLFPGSPIVDHISRRIDLIEDRLKHIENEKGTIKWLEKGLQTTAALGVKYEELRAKLTMYMSLYKALEFEYEYAKIMADKEVSPLEVLQFPSLPEIRSFPKRKKMAVLGLIVGLYMSLVGALFLECIHRKS